jgi:hypothetical protein
MKESYAGIRFRGERQFFSLGTPNEAAAAARARDTCLSLLILQILLQPAEAFLSCSSRPIFAANPAPVVELIN